MSNELVVAFDVDGVLCKGTTLESELLLRLKKFNEKLSQISGEYSNEKDLKETAGLLVRYLQAFEYWSHQNRPMNAETLWAIKTFKEAQQRNGITTKLVVVSGRSNRLTDLTMSKVKEAGFNDLFDGYLLREPGLQFPGLEVAPIKRLSGGRHLLPYR
jgi:FMN phosphatase YigB (HAD superfamily)